MLPLEPLYLFLVGKVEQINHSKIYLGPVYLDLVRGQSKSQLVAVRTAVVAVGTDSFWHDPASV